MQGGLGAVDLRQRVLDRADRRDGRHVQRHLHELAMRLVEVAGVPRDGGQALLNVGQHRAIFRLGGSERCPHVSEYEVVHCCAPCVERVGYRPP